jgi:hypothetical protein
MIRASPHPCYHGNANSSFSAGDLAASDYRDWSTLRAELHRRRGQQENNAANSAVILWPSWPNGTLIHLRDFAMVEKQANLPPRPFE